jgi:hypothetical protein
MLSLADDAALATPAIERAVVEIAEPPRRFAGGSALALRLRKLSGDGLLQARIARQTEHVINVVRLAPRRAASNIPAPCRWMKADRNSRCWFTFEKSLRLGIRLLDNKLTRVGLGELAREGIGVFALDSLRLLRPK